MNLLHWISSLVVLSVALAHIEPIKATTWRVAIRAIGWVLLGISAFAGVMEPVVPNINAAFPWNQLGMIGLAIMAIAYKWQGATRHVRVR